MELLQYIPIPILLVVTISANLGGGVVNRNYSKNVSGGIGGFFLFLVVTSVVSVVSIAAVSAFKLPISGYTAAVGVSFGVVMAVSAVFSMYSIMIGPWSYTTVITTFFSMLIPTLFGAICWHESIDALTIVGIVFVVCSIVLSVQKRKEKTAPVAAGEIAAVDGDGNTVGDGKDVANKKDGRIRLSGKWFICVAIAALTSGGIGVLQKIHQKSAYRGELMTMLVLAFAVEAALIAVALCVFVAVKGKSAVFSRPPQTKKAAAVLITLIVLAGVGGMLNHVINLYLAGVMDSAVFFPLVNGSNLVLVTLLSIFVYRERLSVVQWIGLGVGIAAVLCLCL